MLGGELGNGQEAVNGNERTESHERMSGRHHEEGLSEFAVTVERHEGIHWSARRRGRREERIESVRQRRPGRIVNVRINPTRMPQLEIAPEIRLGGTRSAVPRETIQSLVQPGKVTRPSTTVGPPQELIDGRVVVDTQGVIGKSPALEIVRVRLRHAA